MLSHFVAQKFRNDSLFLHLILRCNKSIFHKHRHRHRSDSAGNGSYEAGRFECLEIGISSKFAIHKGTANIDDSRTSTNHVFFYKSRASSCYYDDIRIFGKFCNIFRVLTTDGNRSSSVHEEKRKRFSDDITFPDHDDIFPLYFHIRFL